jgi:Zn-dependent protease
VRQNLMDTGALIDGLLLFLAFVAMVALHEYAHAWTANRCGDDTPRLQGRLTLDPLAHIDWIGTIALPLILVLMGAASGVQMLFGWGKPVQVNLNNFHVRRRDDILVSVAGPVMNLLIVIALFAILRILQFAGIYSGEHAILAMARLSLFLCFFNLLPIPPLDGGHIMRNLAGISDEAYAMMSRYSFLFFIMIMRSQAVGDFLSIITNSGLALLALPFGWHLEFS